MKAPICPICDSSKNKPLYRIDVWELLKCESCEAVYLSRMPTEQEISDFYQDYHNEFGQTHMAGSDFACNRYQELRAFLAYKGVKVETEVPGSLLDVGCGTGDFMKAAKQAGWHVEGIEVTSEAAQVASANADSRVFVGDIARLSLPECSFELVTSYHVIEHLPDPVDQLQHCYRLLKADGALFIETPNIKSLGARLRKSKWSHIIPPEHVIYFSPRSLEHALRKSGFQSVVVRTSSPQIIESIQHWPSFIQAMARVLYSVAPLFGMGAALQALAFKNETTTQQT